MEALAETPNTYERLDPAISFLLQLPYELKLEIVEMCLFMYGRADFSGYEHEESTDRHDENSTFHYFDTWRDVAKLAAMCQHLYEMITPILYTKDRRYNYSSALLRSAKKGSVRGILKSLEYGSWVGQPDITEFQYFFAYVGSDGYALARTPISSDMTSLHWASYYRQEHAMEVLIQYGADPNSRISVDTYSRDKRFKPLPYYQVMKILCYHMRSIYPFQDREWLLTRLKQGANPLYYALIYGDPSPHSHRRAHEGDAARNDCTRVKAANILLDAGASLITHKGLRMYALHQACGCGDFEMAQFLLENTPSYPRVKDLLGNTPMHYLAMCCPLIPGVDLRPLIELLIQHGAKMNETNYAGCTPLQLFDRVNRYPLYGMATEGRGWGCRSSMDAILALMEFDARVSPDYMPQLRNLLYYNGMPNDATVQALAKVEEMSRKVETTPKSDVEISNEEARRVYVHMNLLWNGGEHRPHVPRRNRRAWTAQQWVSWWQ
ncbi:hypothetical protein CkaCkLH20_10226 [Colletotrichum karsti]|uniref:Ankyrin repeat protein n=1 Tax=Colletotrichum karsti TaxID=1095194 RepID=A0A9P6LDV7_9PEZI|nr:uncharacterized protein CkaCkLH20_10226 [Colletotrichum karsti]KAF9872399.1 hypothetical protein CkaCkLH20_10226 [Colletotrichum karsti]